MTHLEILQNLFGTNIYRTSLVEQNGATLALVRNSGGKNLALVAPAQHPLLFQFSGAQSVLRDGLVMLLCPLDVSNASVLRSLLPRLRPGLAGMKTSFGMGDRLGLATPGHVRAVRASSPSIMPVFAQQSVRENTRTGRNPAWVLADVTWGAFQEGWQSGFGADADHLKTTEDIDSFAAAGYTFFTIDPGEFVDNAAETGDAEEIRRKLNTLPWEVLESFPKDFLSKYSGHVVDLADRKLTIREEQASRAMVKTGKALAHVLQMYRHLADKAIPFELEISVDETDTPTTHAEHVIIVSELKRLGVKWVSLAPRFTGSLEKGVDYIGNLEALRQDIAGHAAIAQQLGPYKLSLHSGSDKFSMYPLIAEFTRGLLHIKTAGTSYLEALRVIALLEPAFFRELLALARERFPQDRASYHISAMLEKVPEPEALQDDDLPGLLEQTDARQVLHVTFGSILAKFGDRLKTSLMANEEAYYADLQWHFDRHFKSLNFPSPAGKPDKKK